MSEGTLNFGFTDIGLPVPGTGGGGVKRVEAVFVLGLLAPREGGTHLGNYVRRGCSDSNV